MARSIGRFVRILYVPAVRDASGDGTEGGRGSILRELLDLTVKDAFAGSPLYKKLQENANAVYEGARNMGSLPEVKRLRDDINGTLGMLARGAGADFEWSLQAPSVGLPTATVRLKEDCYTTTIDRTGHGLQQTFIIAMLGLLHGARAAKAAKPAGDGDGDGSPSIMLAIEEPELYQHPTRAKHIAGLLSPISKDGFKGVAPSVQVIYATHSPYFVGADRIGQIRLLRKADEKKGTPKATGVWSTSTGEIQKRLTDAGAAKHADPDRLEHDFDRVLTPPMSVGFFARTAVLVEGDSDRIAITRAAEILGTPLDEQGVVVIPCGSKSALPGLPVMFRELGVRTYVVWDGDNNKPPEKKRNGHLLSLLDRQGRDCRRRMAGGHERRVYLPQDHAGRGPAIGHGRRALRRACKKIQAYVPPKGFGRQKATGSPPADAGDGAAKNPPRGAGADSGDHTGRRAGGRPDPGMTARSVDAAPARASSAASLPEGAGEMPPLRPPHRRRAPPPPRPTAAAPPSPTLNTAAPRRAHRGRPPHLPLLRRQGVPAEAAAGRRKAGLRCSRRLPVGKGGKGGRMVPALQRVHGQLCACRQGRQNRGGRPAGGPARGAPGPALLLSRT